MGEILVSWWSWLVNVQVTDCDVRVKSKVVYHPTSLIFPDAGHADIQVGIRRSFKTSR